MRSEASEAVVKCSELLVQQYFFFSRIDYNDSHYDADPRRVAVIVTLQEAEENTSRELIRFCLEFSIVNGMEIEWNLALTCPHLSTYHHFLERLVTGTFGHLDICPVLEQPVRKLRFSSVLAVGPRTKGSLTIAHSKYE